MGPTEINGLPAHALLVHVVVILVPVAAVMVALSTVWPAARRRLGVATPVVALIALVSVPVTTHAGEWLEARVPDDPLVRRHAELGDGLLVWVVALFVLAVAFWLLSRRPARAGAGAGAGAGAEPDAGAAHHRTSPRRAGRGHRAVLAVVAALSVVVAVGSVVQTYRIGDSGAKAVWHDGFSAVPRDGGG